MRWLLKIELHEKEQVREEPNPSFSLDVTGKILKFQLLLFSKLSNKVQRVTQNIVDRLVEHVNLQVE